MEACRQGKKTGENILIVNEVLVNGKLHRVKVLERKKETFLVDVNDKIVKVRLKKIVQGKTTAIEINNHPFKTRVKNVQGDVLQVETSGKIFRVQVQYRQKIPTEPALTLKPIATPSIRSAITSPIEKDAVIAPLSGRIVLLRVKVGQQVKEGDIVCVLEAMKMENEVVALKAGLVKNIRVSEGAVVNKGDVIAVIS